MINSSKATSGRISRRGYRDAGSAGHLAAVTPCMRPSDVRDLGD